MSSGDQTEEHIQQFLAELGEQVCVEFAQLLPSEVQLGSWERRLSRLVRVREMVARATASLGLSATSHKGSGRSRAMKRIQYLRAELAEEMRTTLAKRMPSEAQLERWEEQLSRLDRVRELVDQTIPPPSLVDVLEEGQRRLESQSTED